MSDSLPQRMREAAKVLREVAVRFGTHPTLTHWDVGRLNDLADEWDAEDGAAAEREVLEWRLANEFVEALPTKTGLRNGAFHDAARKLIAAGWTKQVTK